MTSSPDLRFVRSEDSTGFTGVSADFGSMNPSAIVRELLQNSLDAALAANRKKAVVRFKVIKVAIADIPGISKYKEALEKAIKNRQEKCHGKLNQQEQIVVVRIQKALKQKQTDVLVVSDNGVGLDAERMEAILADGDSHKPKGGTGSHGVGHMTAFPISNLRYVLYGGVSKTGEWSASGHAILASHYDGEVERSSNGYYTCGKQKRSFLFPKKNQIPSIIQEELDEIEEEHRHGTAVFILGFNSFNKQKVPLEEAIWQAASWSFFPAIHDKKLEVIIQDGNSEKRLDDECLSEVLATYKDKKQNRDFLSGFKADASYQALSKKESKSYEIEILGGNIRVFLLSPATTGKTRINLFRNGMWITNSDRPAGQRGGIPEFYNVFTEHESFEAIILVDAKCAKKFHELICKAEGALHNSLELAKLQGQQSEDLRGGFESIKEWFKEEVPKITSESFSPSDFLTFTDGPSDGNESGEAGMAYKGILVPAIRRPLGFRGGGVEDPLRPKERKKRRRSKNKRSAPRLLKNFTLVKTRLESEKSSVEIHRIRVRCTQDCSREMFLRLSLDENTDATTDRVWEEQRLKIVKANINGKSQKTTSSHCTSLGISLGKMKENSEATVECEIPTQSTYGSQRSIRVQINEECDGSQKSSDRS